MNTNSEKRLNVQEIRDHPWYKNRIFSIDKGYIIGFDVIKFNEEINI